MKKGFLTKEFFGACLLGLGLLIAPGAFAGEGDPKCALPQGLTQDSHSNTWIIVKAKTSDGATIKFDLALKYAFSETAKDYNEAFCSGFEGHLYRLTRHEIQAVFIKTPYVDLAKKGSFILRRAVDSAKKQVNSIMDSAHRKFSVSVDGVGLRNVKARGLDAKDSLRLLTRGIDYGWNYDKELLRNKSFVTKDGLNISLVLDFDYKRTLDSYDITGPDDKGLYLDVLNVVEESLAKEIAHYNLADIVENLGVIRDKAYLQASRRAKTCPDVYLIDLGIKQTNKGKKHLMLSSTKHATGSKHPYCHSLTQ